MLGGEEWARRRGADTKSSCSPPRPVPHSPSLSVGGGSVGIASKDEPRGRTQIVTPRSSRRLDRTRSRRRSVIDLGRIFSTAAAFARPAAVLVALVLLILGYNALAGSKLFLLHRVTISDAGSA
jgi:hypothetical protein